MIGSCIVCREAVDVAIHAACAAAPHLDDVNAITAQSDLLEGAAASFAAERAADAAKLKETEFALASMTSLRDMLTEQLAAERAARSADTDALTEKNHALAGEVFALTGQVENLKTELAASAKPAEPASPTPVAGA